MLNNEKYKMEHQVKEVKIVQHCIQLPIAKNENVSKTAVTFWSLIVRLLTVTVPHKSCKILFLYIFHKSTFQTLLQLSEFSI